LSSPRIISGTAKGLRLKSVPGDSTRPITDQVKEAFFNIIGPDIQGARFFDLFGGTGSVGIEALSRGAAWTRFIDLNKSAVSTIKSNLITTHLEKSAEVFQANTLAYLKREADQKFDYIYVAPPQYKEIWKKALQTLDENPTWLSSDAWIIVQIHPVEYEKLEFTHFEEFEQRHYGSTILVFFQTTKDIAN